MYTHSLEDSSVLDDVTFPSSPDSMLKMPKGICFYYSLMAQYSLFLKMRSHRRVGEKKINHNMKKRIRHKGNHSLLPKQLNEGLPRSAEGGRFGLPPFFCTEGSFLSANTGGVRASEEDSQANGLFSPCRKKDARGSVIVTQVCRLEREGPLQQRLTRMAPPMMLHCVIQAQTLCKEL